MIRFLSSVLLVGCLPESSLPPPPAPVFATRAEALAHVRTRYGEDVASDFERLRAMPGPLKLGGLEACMTTYLDAAERTLQGQDVAQPYRACAATCKDLPAVTQDDARPIAFKYQQKCKAKAAVLDLPEHLSRFRSAIAELKEARGPLSRYEAILQARGALHRAQEAEGADLKVEATQMQSAEDTYRADVARAEAFYKRADVGELQQLQDTYHAQVNDYCKMGMRAQCIRARQSLDAADAELNTLVKTKL